MPSDPLVIDRDAWRPHIEAAAVVPASSPSAQTYRHSYNTASRPVVLKCDDGQNWVVKAQFAGRGVAADCALAAIAHAVGAPVPPTALVSVPGELIAAEPELQNVRGAGPLQPGVWHGSRWIEGIHGTGNKRDDAVRVGPQNAVRYSRLALFYSWCGHGDRQFLYEDEPPHLVHVVDMGHALPGANGWTAATLDSYAPAPSIPADLWSASGLTRAEAEAVVTAIADPVAVISRAAALPREHWGGITMEERIALAHYLSRRFDAMRQAIAAL